MAFNAVKGEEMANIGKSISIHGDLTGNEDLVLEGTVEGRVDLPNNQLTIGANGRIPAEVNAKSVIVIGHVQGDVNGTERVEVQATGVVEGNIRTPKLLVAEGAVLNGKVEMTRAAGSPAAKPAAAGGAGKPAPGGGPDVRRAS